MDYSITAFLGMLQGLTEFFPISSSGHLLLAEHFLDLPVENLKAFDVVLHAGTLVALLVLFWREWWGIIVGSYEFIVQRKKNEGVQLLGYLVLATIPAALVGVLLGDWMDEITRGTNRVLLVAGFFVFVALLLLAAERFSSQKENKPRWKQVLWMSLFQALALLPGVSRSGSTIAAGMLSGLSRSAAARFSFLMLAPVTAGATLLTVLDVIKGELTLPPLDVVMVGFFVSALVSYLCAATLLKLVKKYSLAVFSIYLLIAAGILFIFQ